MTSINLSNTQIEDKGVASLAAFLKKTKNRVVHLDISNTGCTSKGFVMLVGSIQDNSCVRDSLQFFAASNNKFGSEGSTSIWQYLESKKEPNLTHLLVGYTGLNLKIIFDGLSRGKVQLKKLDISGNRCARVDEDCNAMCEYLSIASALEDLNLSNTQIPSDYLEKVLLSINQDLAIHLNLSGNNLGTVGASMISKIAYKLNNIIALDLSDTELGDEGICEIARGFRNNFSVSKLYLNRNFKGGKAKKSAIDNLIKLISSECAINSEFFLWISWKFRSNNFFVALHIEATKHHQLKADLIPFISAIGTNSSLTELNISGHHIGNKGAVSLAKSLQMNQALTTLYWDDNEVGVLG